MSYPQDTTSSRSLRVKARELFGHAGDRRQASSGLNEPPNGLTPPDPTFGLAPMLERVASYLLMFLVFAAEEFVLAAVDRHTRWLWAIFGVFLTASGIVALIHPTSTFAGFADILGFVFLLIGVMWMVQAFAERPVNSLQWLTLISGIMMIVLAFWVSGQFFVVRAYTLLIFAGVWAMTTGIIDVVRAFEIRELGRQLRPRSR